MRTKLERVAGAAETPRPADARPLRTTFTEREINAYLALDGPEFLPPGIAMPRVRLGDDGRVAARAIVDLDAVRRSRERSLLDPLAYLTGAVEVVAEGPLVNGMVLDFSDLKGAMRDILKTFDHTNLNLLMAMPSCENICLEILTRLKQRLPQKLTVRVWEGDGKWAECSD